MGKVVKGFIIGACVCIVIGIVFFVGAAVSGGISGARSILENEGFIGISLNGGVLGISSDDYAEWNTASEHTISLADKDEPSLELELGAGEFEIIESDSKDIVVKSDRQIKVASNGEDISIKTSGHGFLSFMGDNAYNVTIEVPRGTVFDDIDLEIGAGRLTCPNLVSNSLTMEIGAGTIVVENYSCDEANISVGAGEVIVANGQADEMDIEVGMGNFVFNGMVHGNLDADCGMGNVQILLDGSEEDYNYKIDCGMGNVTVGKTSYGGIGAGHQIDNNAAYDFDLDCGMGNLEIRFAE